MACSVSNKGQHHIHYLMKGGKISSTLQEEETGGCGGWEGRGRDDDKIRRVCECACVFVSVYNVLEKELFYKRNAARRHRLV